MKTFQLESNAIISNRSYDNIIIMFKACHRCVTIPINKQSPFTTNLIREYFNILTSICQYGIIKSEGRNYLFTIPIDKSIFSMATFEHDKE